MLATKIQEFFDHNEGTASSPTVEWEGFMVVLRGACRQAEVELRPMILRELEAAAHDYIDAEQQVTDDPLLLPSSCLFWEMKAWLLEHLQSLDFASYSAKTHAEGDRSGLVLARLASRDTKQALVLELRSSDDSFLHSHLEIHGAFMAYYSNFYNLAPLALGEFLDPVQLLWLMQVERVNLDVPPYSPEHRLQDIEPVTGLQGSVSLAAPDP
ncbi:hypothetical protein NDU88_001126 [Pleurodeles waltl]|uniref:Uncharacterized protein n=1 Tax=Pleurodeles waltl TaxID=8319 RepID=A0AAV7V9I2_PLEWA|nr:hypothetical protein NDU88_001126 [Pleurodeles waltl]